jgi:glycogen(starch) synthase
MLNLDYYNFIWGCHLGVFPSFYEPWGYTPVESAAYGVPSITTDLSGFGKYVEAELGAGNREDRGIIVLKREGKSDEEVIMQLKEYMKWYLYLPKEKRIKNKMVAETFVQNLSWKILIENYLQAYKLALEKSR